MIDLRVKKARPILAELRVPGDKSISHRAVIIAALANGPSVITGFLPSPDCLATVSACRALGVRIEMLDPEDLDEPWRRSEELDAPEGSTALRVHGTSFRLTPPLGPVDCGSSGTALALLSGILAGQPFRSILTASPALSRDPVERLIDPLKEMGVKAEMGFPDAPPAITIHGNPQLKSIHHSLPSANAQTKSAILLAGLSAPGRTTVIEPHGSVSRDHTERMLRYYLIKLRTEGHATSIYGGQIPESRDFQVPGDFSSAANWIAAAAAQPGSELIIRGVSLNPSRTTFLKILVRMGAQISEDAREKDSGESFGSIIVRGARLRGTVIEGDEVHAVADELPLVAVVGALAEGRTVVRDAQNLRGQKTDRLAAIAQNLRLMGVPVRELFDSLEITGSGLVKPLEAATVPSHQDHRIAMAFGVAGLFAEGETVVEDVACISGTYPNFAADLHRFQTRRISADIITPVVSYVPASLSANP
jgi:3-phosphoshikimate 1-carboxyvinyltransferase